MDRCELVVGTIVSHPCGAKAKVRCDACQRTICTLHFSAKSPPTCLQCAGEYTVTEAPKSITMDEMFALTQADTAPFNKGGQPGLMGPFDS